MLKGDARRCTKRITINEKYRVWSKYIAFDRKKREISRYWRKARKKSDAEAERLFQRFKGVRMELFNEIEKEWARRDKLMYDSVLKCPRSLRAIRSWTDIRRTDGAPERNSGMKEEKGTELSSNQIRIHLTEMIEQLPNATRVYRTRAGGSRLENPSTHFPISSSDVKEATEKVSGHSASSLDGIPGRMIKQIGGDEYLAEIFNKICWYKQRRRAGIP